MKYKYINITNLVLVILLVITMFFTIDVRQTQAKSYQELNSNKIDLPEDRVIFPKVISLDSNSICTGTMEISRDIVTDARLMATLREGQLQGLSVISASGEKAELLPVKDLALKDLNLTSSCSVPICLSFQSKACFTPPWGGCICVCSSFIPPTANN